MPLRKHSMKIAWTFELLHFTLLRPHGCMQIWKQLYAPMELQHAFLQMRYHRQMLLLYVNHSSDTTVILLQQGLHLHNLQ